MRIPNTISRSLLALVVFTSLTFGGGAALSRSASPKFKAAVHILHTKPRVAKAFHRWITHYYLELWLHQLWIRTYSIPSHLAGVVQCIKDHESGNYAESSHPSAGSGAYQYIPSTWRTWFDKWITATGYKGLYYSYAYQAPSHVQDAVLVYTLTHGGANNWSNAYGYDPCTEGM